MSLFLSMWLHLSSYQNSVSFGDNLEDMLRDHLVLGVNHERLQQKLLEEKGLTFAKSLQMAHSTEAAEKDTQQLKG